MARINVGDIGEFVVEAQQKLFYGPGPGGPGSRQRDSGIRVDLSRQRGMRDDLINRNIRPSIISGMNNIELHQRGREIVGRGLKESLLDWQGGVLQILWKIGCNFGHEFPGSQFWGRGWGTIKESWWISRIDTRLAPPWPKPTLTYEMRPPQQLSTIHTCNFEIAIAHTHQDRPTGGNCGEITSRLSISYGVSQNGRATATVQPEGIGGQLSMDLTVSHGASFACKVVVPYTN